MISKKLFCSNLFFNINKSINKIRISNVLSITWSRSKNTQYMGVKGTKRRKLENFSPQQEINEKENDELNLNDKEYNTIVSTVMNIKEDLRSEQRVFVVQPYIKWGPKKSSINADLKLKEAEALIKSLPEWKVELSIKVPLESLEKKTFFGAGKMEEILSTIKKYNCKGKKITCIFISKDTLSFMQKRILENQFCLPVMDRYSVVIQILRFHAKSAEAKLQVALAEIPYIWGQMKDINPSLSRKEGYFLNDIQRELLHKRENKIKKEIENIRLQRKLLRNKRIKENFPTIAVIGYTNSGKTSLIKALTNEQTLQPRDQLFATLDVTAHSGILPCKLKVIFIDTVGFLSDIPTGLIECFVATLEDAMLSNVIIHVQDLSHENYVEQRKHVESVMKSLSCFTKNSNENNLNYPTIINVGNKIDIIENLDSFIEKYSNFKLVSSKTLVGINDLLLEIESKILETTNRTKLTMRVSSGGEEMAWLYKNAAVTNSKVDPNDEQSLLLDIVIHNSKLQIFKHHFIKKSSK